MILDIIILLILILPMALGLHRGFIYTFVHALGWIGALDRSAGGGLLSD